MGEIKWENEFVEVWEKNQNSIAKILNEGLKNGYDIYNISNFQETQWLRKFSWTGTRIIFRKIQAKDKPFMIPPLVGETLEDCQQFKGAKQYPFCEIHKGAKIDKTVVIGSHTFIGKDVEIGEGVRIQGHCYIPSGVTICKDAFIAPAVTFLNDKYPPSEGKYWGKIIVEEGASIGGGATILPNVIIGKSAVIGAGAVVTKNVPAGETWVGNPAKKIHKRSTYDDHEM